ncbi:4Fe-4S binding protein [Desulfotruncus alcoholivorax]
MVGDKASVAGDPSDCLGCETCVSVCPNEAITLTEN